MRFLVLTLLAASLHAPGSPASRVPVKQGELAAAEGKERDEAKAQMQAQYNRLLALVATDTSQRQRIERAQRAWEVYRAAQMEAFFGCEDTLLNYGSAFSMCYVILEGQLYVARAKELRHMGDSIADESDICSWRATCER